MDVPIQIISRKWALNIILELMQVNKREQNVASLNYSELRELIPEISPKMLAIRLQELIDFYVVERIENPISPKKVRYKLTEKGLAFLPVLMELRKWGKNHGELDYEEKCINDECRHANQFKEISDFV